MCDAVRLGDVVTMQRGTTYQSARIGEPGPILLGLGAIERNGGFRQGQLRSYGGSSPSNLLLHPGDLFVSLKDVTQSADLLGAVAQVPASVRVGRLTQDTVRLDVHDRRITTEYLYWMLRAPQYRAYCRERATGTTNLGLSREDFLSYQIPTPTRELVTLVELLGALDEKIAANVELVATVDALAEAKFDQMLIDSAVMPLTDVARFINGKAFTKGATGTGRVVVRIAELNSGLGSSTVYNDIDVADDHLARPGDLLFAWSGSLTLHRWFRPEAIVNQHIFKVIPKDAYPIWCAHGLIDRKLDEFKAIAADKATTMGHIQRRHLEELVDVPMRATIESHDVAMTALWNRALLAEQESLTLASVRDALLPQLMSGKLRVKDAEKAVEEVL